MTPLGWTWAAAVWGYALIWFLVSDRIKLLAYRVLDPAKKAKKKSEPVRDLTPAPLRHE
jgi:H+-transporting ATPase